MSAAVSAIEQLLRIIAGMLVWASALVLLYAGRSLGCQHIGTSSIDGLANPITALLLALAVVHLAVLGWLLWRWFEHPMPAADASSKRVRMFCRKLEGLVLAFSVVAVLWLAIPVVMVPPCSG